MKNHKTEIPSEEEYSSPALDGLLSSISPRDQEQTDYKMKLAAKIFEGVKKKGWTQTQFAEVMGKSVSLISRWLSGTHNFTVDTLVDIQHVLGINLLNGEDHKEEAILSMKLTVSANPKTPVPFDLQHSIDIAGGLRATDISLTTPNERQW